MTTGIKLGTALSKDKVFSIAKECGFNIEPRYPGVPEVRMPVHNKVPDLGLQIHTPPTWFYDIPAIKTAIEFDDYSHRFPDNPEAISVLEQMADQIPDLLCREGFLPSNPSEIMPAKVYIAMLRQK